MNFKEIYKAANDEISGDRSLIDAVIKKSEKKTAFKMAYPLACAAAALLIVAGVSMYPKNPVKQVPNINVASNKEKGTKIKTDISIANDKQEGKISEKTEEIPTQKDYNIKTKETPIQNNYNTKAETITESIPVEKEPTIEKSYAKEIINQDNLHEGQKNDELSEIIDVPMVAMLDINVIEPTVSSTATLARSSGGGALEEDESIEYEGMTAEQYYEYIGADITQKVELPDGVVFEEFFGTTVKRDTSMDCVISDNAEFYASSEQKYVSLSVSKLSGDVQNKLDDETLKKSDIFGNAAVVEGYENTHRMYVKHLDVYYNIYSEGLTPEEIEKLLVSICKN